MLALLTPASAQNASPDAPDVDRLVEALSGADAIAREAAIRQLIPVPHSAAARVVNAFIEGQLSTRLACVELLEAWGAPIDGIDPWRRETLTPAHIERLRTWAASVVAAGPSTQPATLPALDSAAADREIALMLDAADEQQVRIVRERLARWHETLLPVVREQVRAASTDLSRQRLTALRYRLVSSDELAATWIEGIERLASTDPATRRAALDELARRSAASEVPLLLELFSDPDPLMREGSLRLLHSAGGAASAAALVRLLNDPEPNVRAAVLKQLAEKPRAEVVEPIAEYVAQEKDHDLVVHAVRVLRAVKGQQAMDCLQTLLAHESWQVRAEVVEAIGEMTTSRGNPVDMAPVYASMVKLLDDPDGFVVSRAMMVLSRARLGTTVEPLMAAAEKHPELAPEIIRTVAADEAMGRMAAAQLAKLASNPRADIRAAAVSALAAVAPQTSTAQIVAAMKDSDSSVRTAAAWACLAAMESLKPEDGYVTRTKWFGLSQTHEKVDIRQWYEDFRAGKQRPEWTATIAAGLEEMLNADSAEERVAAAAAIVPLGRDDKAMPVLLAAVQAEPALAEQAARALSWLPTQSRVELFEKLASLADSDQTRSMIMSYFVSVPDPAAAEPLWNTIKADSTNALADTVETSLAQLYFGEQYYNASSLPASQKQPAIDAAKAHLNGPELQRTIAMALLLRVSPDDAAEAAQSILDDPAAGEWLRLDALQVLLMSKPTKEAEAIAVTHMADPVMRKAALPFLAGGADAIRTLRGSISVYYSSVVTEFSSDSQAIAITAPQGLTAEQVREALAGGDDLTKAYAGYLLVLLGERDGLEPLMKFWREQPKSSYENEWTRLMYRAIAVTNDPELVPVLEEIYNAYDKDNYWQIRTFYWTIRSMTGEPVLALRKKIRDEIGMERLR